MLAGVSLVLLFASGVELGSGMFAVVQKCHNSKVIYLSLGDNTSPFPS